jgi:carbonic anhydrase
MYQLHRGLHQFKTEIHALNEEFFEKLAQGQAPDAVFITCSDSRIVPNLLTQTDPGQLFIVRNAGNIVPAHGDYTSGEEATIEYALEGLKVQNIIVCGHTKCGAMAGILKPESLAGMPSVEKWLATASKTKEIIDKHYSDLPFDCQHSVIVQENVLAQLENLRSLPCVARKLWKREVELHGWVYDIENGEVFVYDPIDEEFQPLRHGRDGKLELAEGLGMPR